jgi:hypothetical protein
LTVEDNGNAYSVLVGEREGKRNWQDVDVLVGEREGKRTGKTWT